MWECEHCGCKGITGDVPFCPQCFVPRSTPAAPVAEGEGTPAGPVESGQVGDPDSGPVATPQASPQATKRSSW